MAKKTIRTRKITDEKKEQFRAKLSDTDWTDVTNEHNCNTKWEKLMHIQEALDSTLKKLSARKPSHRKHHGSGKDYEQARNADKTHEKNV